MEITEIVIKNGLTYSIPTPVWNLAEATFDQQYKPGVDVRSLCRNIGEELMPTDRHDPFSSERLARCLMSVKGRAGGKKAAANRHVGQLPLAKDWT